MRYRALSYICISLIIVSCSTTGPDAADISPVGATTTTVAVVTPVPLPTTTTSLAIVEASTTTTIPQGERPGNEAIGITETITIVILDEDGNKVGGTP